MTEVFDVNIDGYQLPVMVINLKSRSIVSIPTQIGCPIGCIFCISSESKFVRNLKAPELIQLAEAGLARCMHQPALLSFTGEGEPFLNIRAINEALFTLDNYDEISYIRICTSGIKPERIGHVLSQKPIDLQFSLHSPFDEQRREIIPNSKPLDSILEAIAENESIYNEIAVNYVLMPGVNDRYEDLCQLKAVVPNHWTIKLNPLIEKEAVRESLHRDAFIAHLETAGFNVKAFSKIGSDIKNQFYKDLSYQEQRIIA